MDGVTPDEIDLLAIDRGSVSAPAGCGKTHLIARTLTRHSDPKPILVLTHTNAGVAALRGRLDRFQVPRASYRLATLDGWAMRLIGTFPGRSGHDPSILALGNPRSDYHAIRVAAVELLQAGHISDVLSASYDRLIVDEYQDCSEIQHFIVGLASNTLRTCVLGDPLQAIFNFAGRLADWEKDVREHFPPAGELSTPWRWINAGEQGFGEWLLDARRSLLAGGGVDLSSAPANVVWLPLDGISDEAIKLEACRTPALSKDGGVLIMAESKKPDRQRRFARNTPDAVAIESVDLGDLVSFARAFRVTESDALDRIIEFAESVMANLGGTETLERVREHLAGTSTAPPSDAEAAALRFAAAPTHRGALGFLSALNAQTGVRVHRPTVFRSCLKALEACPDDEQASFLAMAIKMREENRLLGRPLPGRAVGSTLLLKGLEAEVAVILDAHGMNPAHLYVAMTRGARKLVVCSRTPKLPAW
ncbi:UvrD-helicase domain-containing protein [Belnapia arida]|uniref:UvrD-helicase domain-containing protein n=1 Tax=Belnapia arida TaxID=2804533 RepID=UPI002E2CB413|nr:UvrD-helicase domain-containing protein [Belnapia arida]